MCGFLALVYILGKTSKVNESQHESKKRIFHHENHLSFFEAAAVNMNESLNDLHRSGAALGHNRIVSMQLQVLKCWGHHDQARQEISSTTELWKSQPWLQKWNYLQRNWTNINTNKAFRKHRFGFMMFHVILSQVPVEGGSWLSRTGNAREFNEHPGSDEIEKSQVKECKAHHGPTYIAVYRWCLVSQHSHYTADKGEVSN